MSDPFDFLNPIASTKTSAEKAQSQPPNAPVRLSPVPLAPINVVMGTGMGMPASHGNTGMGMTMGAQSIFNNGGMIPGQFVGAPGMGLGLNQPFGQQSSVLQPPMYDNIKKLLEKKPVVDEVSMDFLENLGGGIKASGSPFIGSVQNPVNPFGVANPPIEIDFSLLGGNAPTCPAPVQPTSPASGTKSSALALRLAQGKRPTQEAARKNLGINAGAFSSSVHPKISLKTVVGSPASSASTGEPTVDDFVAGTASLASVDDIFAASSSNPTVNPPASNSNDIFW